MVRHRLRRIARNSLWLSLTHYATPPFPQKSRSARLFGCKRPHDCSLSLPIFAVCGQLQGLSLRLRVIIGLRFFDLQRIARVRIPLTICKKITVQCLSHHTFILGGEQGVFRRTAVRLRIASLFNHGLSNSPPDCFHRQSRPSLFESLAVLSTKKQRVQQMLYPLFSGGEQGIFRRTAVRLRIASLFNHGLSNSPPDCFHRQSRPSLFESLAALSTKNKGYSKCYTLCFWRRARDSNPRNRFGGLHDFQSCSFDQLGQLSVLPEILYTIV